MALKMFRHKFPTVASRLKQWRRPGLDVVHAVLRSWHSLLGTQARLLQRDRFEKGIAECQSRNLTEPVGDQAANHNWPRLAILLLFYIVFITHGLSTAVSVSMVTSRGLFTPYHPWVSFMTLHHHWLTNWDFDFSVGTVSVYSITNHVDCLHRTTPEWVSWHCIITDWKRLRFSGAVSVSV